MSYQPRTNLNLLPARYRRWLLIRASIALWAGVWLIGIAAACTLVWRADTRLISVRQELAKFQRMHAPTLTVEREVDEMRQRLAQLAAEEQAAAHLENDRPALALLGLMSKASQACSERLHVRECMLERRKADRGSSGIQGQVLSIKGAALDLYCVARLQGELRDAGMFDRVELRPTKSEPLGDASGFVFHVECFY